MCYFKKTNKNIGTKSVSYQKTSVKSAAKFQTTTVSEFIIKIQVSI